MRIFSNHPDKFGKLGGSGPGLSLREVSQYIGRQYRGAMFYHARKNNLEELCYSGLITPTLEKFGGKPHREARYAVTHAGMLAFPEVFTN